MHYESFGIEIKDILCKLNDFEFLLRVFLTRVFHDVPRIDIFFTCIYFPNMR